MLLLIITTNSCHIEESRYSKKWSSSRSQSTESTPLWFGWLQGQAQAVFEPREVGGASSLAPQACPFSDSVPSTPRPNFYQIQDSFPEISLLALS